MFDLDVHAAEGGELHVVTCRRSMLGELSFGFRPVRREELRLAVVTDHVIDARFLGCVSRSVSTHISHFVILLLN